MFETFTITFRKGAKKLRVAGFGAEGLVLEKEIDSTPRSLLLEFDGRSPVTKHRMDRVRQLNGWGPWDFPLQPSVRDGDLVFAGVAPDALPSGKYWLKIWIEGMARPSMKTKVTFDIPDDGDAPIAIDVAEDPRKIELTTDPSQFDPEFQRILDDPNTHLDTLDGLSWLDSDAREARKACLLNLLAKLRTAPTGKNPLIQLVRSAFFAGVDRVYANVDPALAVRLNDLAQNPKKPFFFEGEPTSPTHLKLLDRMKLLGINVAGYHLKSYRQETKGKEPSMQLVVAIPPDTNPLGACCADLDLDLGNPLQDVMGFFIHVGELIDPGKTDHLKISRLLKNTPAFNFIYYKVV